jgi:hypothetical protein
VKGAEIILFLTDLNQFQADAKMRGGWKDSKLDQKIGIDC